MSHLLLFGLVSGLIIILTGGLLIIWRQQHQNLVTMLSQQLQNLLTNLMREQQQQVGTQQLYALKTLTESIDHNLHEVRSEINSSIMQQTNSMNNASEKLTLTTDAKLHNIAQSLDQKLTSNLEKSHETMNNLLIRLTLIDKAQQKIADLSQNVLALQDILSDKKARGSFGEVQLSVLLGNLFPTNSFSLQHLLSNGKRADCLLYLPQPTGNIVIDAKFPLENYQKSYEETLTNEERNLAKQQFKQDVKRHIQAIANKYIIPGETADSALMFIPAEAIFAEIHAHYPELVQLSYSAHVWLTSPTTLMAILTTARAVIRDDHAKKAANFIHKELQNLGQEFKRFNLRIENLYKHINLANNDADEAKRSANKLLNQFNQLQERQLDDKK